MSYDCRKHNWSHYLADCPTCRKLKEAEVDMGFDFNLFIKKCIENGWIDEHQAESVKDFMHPSIMGLLIKMNDSISLLKQEVQLVKDDYNKSIETNAKLHRVANRTALKLDKIKEVFYDD